MSGINPVLQLGPDTVTVNVAVVGGQLVEPDTTAPGKVKPCTAGSTQCLGVALEDGSPTSAQTALNYATARPEIAVAYSPVDCRVIYTAAANFGDVLIAAATGQVTPAGAAPDARTIVGRCTEPLGVGAGAVGRIRLR